MPNRLKILTIVHDIDYWPLKGKQAGEGVTEVKGQTGCPITVSRYSPSQKIKRFPDAIGVGFAKSGTGTLSILDCHPDIVYTGKW